MQCPRCPRVDNESASTCVTGPRWRYTVTVISISKVANTVKLTEITKRMRRTDHIFEDSGDGEKRAKWPEKDQ